MTLPHALVLIISSPAWAVPAAGWPDNSGEWPTIVLFGEVPSPPGAVAEPLLEGSQLPVRWAAGTLERRAPEPARLTLISARGSCEVPVVENLVVELRVWPDYRSQPRTRLARRIDASACPPSLIWYFGVIGDAVAYEAFGRKTQAVPPEIAAVVPEASAPRPDLSVGGFPIDDDTWLAYTLDSRAVLVRNGALLETVPTINDGLGVVRADGQTWLFAGTTWEDRRHALYDLNLDPVKAVAWAEIDPETRDLARKSLEERIAAREAESLRRDWEWLLAGVGVLATSTLIGGLIGAVTGRRLRGALIGALAAPLVVYGLASLVAGVLTTLLSVALGSIAYSGPSGWLSFQIEPSEAACVLLLGLSWVAAALLVLSTAVTAIIPPLRGGRWLAVPALGATLVQHSAWAAITSYGREVDALAIDLHLLLPPAVAVLAAVLLLALVLAAWERPRK